MAAPVQIGFCFALLKPHMYEVKIVHTKNQVEQGLVPFIQLFLLVTGNEESQCDRRQYARTIVSPVVAYTHALASTDTDPYLKKKYVYSEKVFL